MAVGFIRKVGIRLFELCALYGAPLGLLTIIAYVGDLQLVLPVVYIFVSLLLLVSVIMLYFMPVSCRAEGGRVVMKTPVRSIEAVLLEEPRREKGSLIPPGRTKALFCSGWRFPTTLLSDCGDEYFFSTPDCDGNWLVAEAELTRKGRREKRSSGSAAGKRSQGTPKATRKNLIMDHAGV
jgi:hypothetical protein